MKYSRMITENPTEMAVSITISNKKVYCMVIGTRVAAKMYTADHTAPVAAEPNTSFQYTDFARSR